MFLYVHRFLPFTRVEGPGERACIWVQGCSIHCPGCAVPWTWSQNGGEAISVESLAERIMNGPTVEGVTFLGGEPFDQAEALAELGARMRKGDLSVMTFTGYTLDKICHSTNQGWHRLLSVTDLLIDGPFRRDLLDLSRPWVGSSNQRYHFLSDRYRHLEPQICSIPNRLEVRLQPDGQVLINGMATSANLDAFITGIIMNNIPTSHEIREIFRSGDAANLQNIKRQIMQIFESDNLALQQKFINQYLPQDSIRTPMIESLEGSPEWAVTALSATAQIYAYERPYELGAVLGDVCYQLAFKALSSSQPRVPARYLYFGGEGTRSCAISLKQLNQNEKALAYLNQTIPWFEHYNGTEILPSLYLERVEVNLALQRFEEANMLLNQLEVGQLSPTDQQTYKRLKQVLDKKLKSVTELDSEQSNESDEVVNTLRSLVDNVEPLLKFEPEAQNDFDRLQELFEKLKHQNSLTAKDFALAQQEGQNTLVSLKTGAAEPVTVHAIIAPISKTFEKLLELSQQNGSKL